MQDSLVSFSLGASLLDLQRALEHQQDWLDGCHCCVIAVQIFSFQDRLNYCTLLSLEGFKVTCPTGLNRHSNGHKCSCFAVCVYAHTSLSEEREKKARIVFSHLPILPPHGKNKMTIHKNKYKGIRLTDVRYKLHSLQQVSRPMLIWTQPCLPMYVLPRPSSQCQLPPAPASSQLLPEQTKTLSYQHRVLLDFFF